MYNGRFQREGLLQYNVKCPKRIIHFWHRLLGMMTPGICSDMTSICPWLFFVDFCSSENKKYTCASAARLWGINWARRDEGVKKKATRLRLKPRPRLLDDTAVGAHQTAVSSCRVSGVIDRAELCLITSSSVISVLWIHYKRALPCS